MIGRGCPRERETQQAAATGRWTAELRGHVALCASCPQIARVTEALAAPLASPPASVDPLALLAGARQFRRLRAEARVSRILTGAQLGVCAVALGGMVAFAARPSLWRASPVDHDNLWWLYAGALVLTLAVVALSTSLWRDEFQDRSAD